jgi:hypothetical protein
MQALVLKMGVAGFGKFQPLGFELLSADFAEGRRFNIHDARRNMRLPPFLRNQILRNCRFAHVAIKFVSLIENYRSYLA